MTSRDACRGGSAQTLFAADRKSTRLNSSHLVISYAVLCLKKKNTIDAPVLAQRRLDRRRASAAVLRSHGHRTWVPIAIWLTSHRALGILYASTSVRTHAPV